ncbi:MAG TPA: acyltransferase [Streptosporangiaceae bacterium]|jgi:acetyltransferase-like isoleucine patch superfamily enzyme
MASNALTSGARRICAGLMQRGWRRVQALGMISADTTMGRRFAAMGRGASIAFPPATIFGEPWIRIGADTLIGQHITLSAGMVPGLDLGPDPVVTIGARCTIGRGSHIVGHQSIEIGDDVFTGPYVYVTDQNHAYEDPDTPIGRQWPKNEPVRIGPGCWLGTGAIVLPGTTIGRNVVVAGGAVVRGTFGDHCVLAGVPARVIRRYVPGEGWIRVNGTELDATAVPPA